MKIIRLFTALLLLSISASAQNRDSGLYVPSNSFDVRFMNVEPVCWVNEANELNAYIQGEDNAEIITMIGREGAEMPVLPKIIRVSYATSGFMLHGEDGTNYFFGLDKEESGQVLQIMKYGTTGDVKTYNGIGIARHHWLEPKGPELEELRAAKSIYDVLDK